MRSDNEQHSVSRLLTIVVILAAMALFSGCARSAETIKVKTDHGAESIKAPSPVTLFSIARILEAKGQEAESEQVLRSLLVNHSDFLPAYNELAGILVHQRRLSEALVAVQAGLKVAPNDPVLLNNAGMCQLLMKSYGAAKDYFGMAGAISPENARYRANMALCLALQGETREAQAFYDMILPPSDVRKNLEILERTRLSEVRPQAAVVPEKKSK